MSNEIDQQSATMVDAGVAALREAFVAEGLEYALARSLEQYALALDAAQRVADHAALRAADRHAYLSYTESKMRDNLLKEAIERRERAVHSASNTLTYWRQSYSARQRSLPQSLHEFTDG